MCHDKATTAATDKTPNPNNKGLKYPELIIQKTANTNAKPKKLFIKASTSKFSSNVFLKKDSVKITKEDGKSIWYTIGKYPEWSIRDARREYEDLYEQVREYVHDPIKEIKEEEEIRNKTMHRVPLNYYALDILDSVSTHTSNSEYVFGSTRAMDRKREQLGIENITPHDLRRTATTWLAGVGLLPHYAKLMLNHKDSRSDVINSVYIQYSYDAEKHKATDVLALVLDTIVKCPTIDDVPSLEEVRKLVQESNLFVG